MQLTTPVTNDNDAVFPGEEWFLYYRTSASLWKDKLKNHSGNRVILPINWAFHSENGESTDFGEHRPETDLVRLISEIEDLGKETIILLSLGPMPFLPAGGIPPLLARNPSVDRLGLYYTLLGPDDEFFKIYSFFDPRVYQGHSKFLASLSRYLRDNGLSHLVRVVEYGRMEGEAFSSFFYDQGPSYVNAFSRFLDAKKEEGIEVDLTQETLLHEEFYKTITKLYWEGLKRAFQLEAPLLRIALLGSGRDLFFSRLFERYSEGDLAKEVALTHQKRLLCSSVLIPPLRKGPLLKDVLEHHEDRGLHNRVFTDQVFSEREIMRPVPYCLARLCYFEAATQSAGHWHQLGLVEVMDSKYPWLFSLEDLEVLRHLSEEEESEIFFVPGVCLNEELLKKVLKRFLRGGRIVIDMSNIEDGLKRKLESFQIENSLKSEIIRKEVSLTNISLGQGQLLLFSGEELSALNPSQRAQFWEKLIATFEFTFLQLKGDEGLLANWRERAVGPNELSFEKISRVSLYNPTSYKKKASLALKKHFALIKVLDEVHVTTHTTPNELTIQLMPGGRVTYDFGLYS